MSSRKIKAGAGRNPVEKAISEFTSPARIIQTRSVQSRTSSNAYLCTWEYQYYLCTVQFYVLILIILFVILPVYTLVLLTMTTI